MLYIVATPIGNMREMSFRAVDVLNEVDFIAAEDTRVTLKLLNHFGLKKPLVSYYEHNKRERGEQIAARLEAGEAAAAGEAEKLAFEASEKATGTLNDIGKKKRN